MLLLYVYKKIRPEASCSHLKVLIFLTLYFSLINFIVADNAYPAQATLSWNAPTTNVDGSPLTDLAGYKVYYGTSSGNYTNQTDVGNVLTSQITNLTAGITYYFAVTAYDTSGNESGYSNEVSKTIPSTTQYTLTVTKSGTGTGTVTSSPAGINCGADCSQVYSSGTQVTLTASASIGSTFAGWSGACSVTTGTTCTTTMNSSKSITAKFNVQPANITIVTPNGGEVIPAESTYNIRWTATVSAVQFKLFYTLNNGQTWKPINNNNYVTGTSYSWRVPTVNNNKLKCRIAIIGYSTNGVKVGSDKSDLPFKIEVVRVTLPNGNESLISGSQHSINWTTNATIRPIHRVVLYYTKNAKASPITWIPIYVFTGSNLGTYNWKVPDVLNSKIYCKVRVVLKDESGNTIGSDLSDGYFSIAPQ